MICYSYLLEGRVNFYRKSIIGLVVALDRYVSFDHEAVIAGWNAKARWLADQLQGIPGLRAEYALNTMGYADVDLAWDENFIPLTEQEVKKRLKEGEPSLVYDGTTVRTRLLREGEEIVVARRLREFFETEALVSRLVDSLPKSSVWTGHFQGGVKLPRGGASSNDYDLFKLFVRRATRFSPEIDRGGNTRPARADY